MHCSSACCTACKGGAMLVGSAPVGNHGPLPATGRRRLRLLHPAAQPRRGRQTPAAAPAAVTHGMHAFVRPQREASNAEQPGWSKLMPAAEQCYLKSQGQKLAPGVNNSNSSPRLRPPRGARAGGASAGAPPSRQRKTREHRPHTEGLRSPGPQPAPRAPHRQCTPANVAGSSWQQGAGRGHDGGE